MSRMNGRVRAVTAQRKINAAASLGEAIAAIMPEQVMDNGESGIDVGAIVSAIASALGDLGFEINANPGGFGRRPSLVVVWRDEMKDAEVGS